MSRHGHKEMERCKRIAAKTSVEVFKAKAQSLHRLCSAASLLAELASELDKRAEGKTVAQDELHTYRDMRFNAEILRMAQKVIERETQQNGPS